MTKFVTLAVLLYLFMQNNDIGHAENITDANPDFCINVPENEKSALCTNSFTSSLCLRTCKIWSEGTTTLKSAIVRASTITTKTQDTNICKDANDIFCIHNQQCMSQYKPCAGKCLKEGYWNCDGKCIKTNQTCNDQCFDKEKWLCNGTCISKDDPCGQSCHYNKLKDTNHEYDNLGQWHYKDPRVFCPETSSCKTVTHKDCNFNNVTKSDVCAISKDVCSSKELINRGCGNDSRPCDGHWPGQCYLKVAEADGFYDCIDRSDETKTEQLWLISNEITKNEEYQKNYDGYQDFNFTTFGLKSCGNASDSKGLTCANLIKNKTICVPFNFWCKRVYWNDTDDRRYDDFCPSYDDVLCGNTTFWNSTDRNDSSCEFTCSSWYSGQCIPSANVCNNDTRWNNYGNMEKENCRDKSDEICDDLEKCTEFGYTFCSDGLQCVHPDLLCDGYYNCKDGSDEDESRCNTKYCDKSPSASYSCPHKYTNITICASLCNNYEECFDGMDEKTCGINLSYTIGIVTVFVLLSTFISFMWDRFVWGIFNKSQLKEKKVEHKSQQRISLNLTRLLRLENLTKKKKHRLNALLKQLHQLKEYSNELRFLINFCKTSFSREKSVQCLRYLYNFELSYHNKDSIECEQCLKASIGTNIMCQFIIDAQYPGLMDKLPDPFLEGMHDMTKHSYWHQLMRFTKVSSYYLDLGKDVALITTLVSTVNVTALSFMSFSSQIILIYVLSIFIPILLNWIYVAFFNLEIIFGYNDKKLRGWKRIIAQFSIFFAAPFLPGIIIYQRITNFKNIDTKVVEFNRNIEKIDDIRMFKSYKISQEIQRLQEGNFKLKEVLVVMQKCEMVEAIVQMILSTCLLFMNYWKISLTQNELQGFFKEDIMKFLVISIPLLLKKLITTVIETKTVEKNGFLPIVGILTYSIYGFLNVCVRVASIILYFSVPLGLFNILTHWLFETMNDRHGLKWREYDQSGNPIKFSYYNSQKGEFDVIEIKDLSHALLTNEPYTKYTGLSLFWYYILFLVGIIAHLILVLTLERKFRFGSEEKVEDRVDHKKEESQDKCIEKEHHFIEKHTETQNPFSIFLHSLMTLVLTSPISDWDEVSDKEVFIGRHKILQGYKENWRKVFKQFTVSLLIRFLENVLLITPMLFLYAKASERHSFLEETIGPNNLEIKSITTIWILLVGGITMIGASIPLEIIGFLVYNYYGHPWKRFISTDIPVDQGSNVDFTLATVKNDNKNEPSRSKENSTLDIDENVQEANLKSHDINETSHNANLDKENKINEEKISLKASEEVNPLDEAYEILEKQLESLRLLKR